MEEDYFVYRDEIRHYGYSKKSFYKGVGHFFSDSNILILHENLKKETAIKICDSFNLKR